MLWEKGGVVHMWNVEVRDTLWELVLFPLCGSQEPNLGSHAWWLEPLPSKPFILFTLHIIFSRERNQIKSIRLKFGKYLSNKDLTFWS